jgi:hypothetical protein
MIELIPQLSTACDLPFALDILKNLQVTDRLKKRLLAEWFQKVEGTKCSPVDKLKAYDVLLGKQLNSLMRG